MTNGYMGELTEPVERWAKAVPGAVPEQNRYKLYSTCLN